MTHYTAIRYGEYSVTVYAGIDPAVGNKLPPHADIVLTTYRTIVNELGEVQYNTHVRWLWICHPDKVVVITDELDPVCARITALREAVARLSVMGFDGQAQVWNPKTSMTESVLALQHPELRYV